jgi:ribose 5-phosphate isomerase B
MHIAVGADHAGFELKQALAALIATLGHQTTDFGTNGPASVDYPDHAAAVGRAVATGQADLGLLVCGSGIGVAIAANKIHGVRAATCNDLYAARLSRAHNDANIVCLGARVVGPGLAEEIVRTFLGTSWDGGRHQQRVVKIHELERAEG